MWTGCGIKVGSPLELSGHLNEAHGILSKETLEDKAFFCHQCAWWATSEYAWEKHCEQHLKELKDPFCGNMVFRGASISAALCPFCLGKSGKSSARYRQFPGGTFRDHVRRHLVELYGFSVDMEPPKREGLKIQCPHPLCRGQNNRHEPHDFLEHLASHHRIELPCKRGSNSGKRVKKTIDETTDEATAEAADNTSDEMNDSDETRDGMTDEATGEEAMLGADGEAGKRGTGKRKFDCVSDETPSRNKLRKR